VVEGLDKGILSLLYFFCFDEEVLSRGISNIISKKLMLLMVGSRMQFSSHTLYADNIFILCRIDTRTLQN